jgi:hypothetical protein
MDSSYSNIWGLTLFHYLPLELSEILFEYIDRVDYEKIPAGLIFSRQQIDVYERKNAKYKAIMDICNKNKVMIHSDEWYNVEAHLTLGINKLYDDTSKHATIKLLSLFSHNQRICNYILKIFSNKFINYNPLKHLTSIYHNYYDNTGDTSFNTYIHLLKLNDVDNTLYFLESYQNFGLTQDDVIEIYDKLNIKLVSDDEKYVVNFYRAIGILNKCAKRCPKLMKYFYNSKQIPVSASEVSPNIDSRCISIVQIFNHGIENYLVLQSSSQRIDYGVNKNDDLELMKVAQKHSKEAIEVLYNDGFLLVKFLANRYMKCSPKSFNLILLTKLIEDGEWDLIKWTRNTVYKYDFGENVFDDMQLLRSINLSDPKLSVFYEEDVQLFDPDLLIEIIDNPILIHTEQDKNGRFVLKAIELNNIKLLKWFQSNDYKFPYSNKLKELILELSYVSKEMVDYLTKESIVFSVQELEELGIIEYDEISNCLLDENDMYSDTEIEYYED